MYVFTNENDEIFHISETLDYQENGNALVDNGNLAIAKGIWKEIYTVNEIPEEVEPAKYCYTKRKGFYINENYIEPPLPAEQEIANLKEQITELQLALVELYEGGIE